jgi:hypothetical protein
MAPSDRYGSLTAPEERVQVAVRENPVQLVRSAYKAWLPAARRDPLRVEEGRRATSWKWWTAWLEDGPRCERLYQHAVTHLAPLAQAFKDVRPRELAAIIRTVNPEDTSASGLFLSALLNATALPALEGVFGHDILGWRLAPGKTLIAREGSHAYQLGERSKGVLINHGCVASDMAHSAEGVTVNLGSVLEIGRFAAGVQVNAHQAESLGGDTRRGIHLNYGRVTNFGESATGDAHINLGRVTGNLICNAGGFSVNFGRVEGWLAYGHDGTAINRGRYDGVSLAYECRDSVRAEGHIKALKRELRPLAVLKKLRDAPRKADAFILAYDWGGLERRMTELRKDIEEQVKR